MLRAIFILALPLCGLVAETPAQVRMGVNRGRQVSVRPNIGPRVQARTTGPRVQARTTGPRVHARTTDRVERPRLAPRGHYRTVTRRVWVPGCHQVVTVPARYAWSCNAWGVRCRVVVSPATCSRVWQPGYWTHRQQRVWVGS